VTPVRELSWRAMAPGRGSRAAGFAWVTLAYAVAGVAAWGVAHALSGVWPLWRVVAAADMVATVVVFAFSFVLDNSSVYDAYWSVAPMAIAPALALVGEAPVARKVVVTALVLVWGARLTYNWARGWQGLAHEDWRYVEQRRHGRVYWVVSFVGLHTMPTVLVFGGCLALFPALVTGTEPLGALDVLAFAVTAGAIALEGVADQQLRAFRLSGPAPGTILETGVWAWSRHPNYLGEVSLWWGLALFALAADHAAWWVLAGPAAITLLFSFVSVPLLDKRSLARRPEYAEHMARVPALFPWPRGRR
jgi:steroid 5-alpha reductase family enzyme